LRWLSLGTSKFHDWKERYGKANEHNGLVPRDWWLEPWEKLAILDFHDQHPLDGYRRLTFMMLDEDVVAVSPASVYRVLRAAGRLDRRRFAASKKGTGFVQPIRPHQHWHVDVSYINIAGTFYYLTSVLDGCSRYIVHWDLRESMTERDIEVIVQHAFEQHPGAQPRIISDNGPQFIARDFKEFIRLVGINHVRTSPYYPQSNGKLERWHGSLKRECIRMTSLTSLHEARRLVTTYVDHLQPRSLTQRAGIHQSRRQTPRPRRGDLRRARPQARKSAATTPPSQASCPGGCMMPRGTSQSLLTWAEHRALLRSNPSAGPGAKTGVRTGPHRSVPLPSCCRAWALRDWHQRAKPSRHDAATCLTGRASALANANCHKFQFTLNQDSWGADVKFEVYAVVCSCLIQERQEQRVG